MNSNFLGSLLNPFRLNFTKNRPNFEINLEGIVLKDLLKQIKKEKNIENTKEISLRILQLYFDGIIEQKTNNTDTKILTEQIEILNKIMRNLGDFLKIYYSQDKYKESSKIKDILNLHKEEIIKYGSVNGCKRRHFHKENKTIKDFICDIVKNLQNNKPDLLLPIASGGFESGLLIGKYLRMNDYLPIRCSTLNKKDEKILIPSYFPQKTLEEEIYGKNILLAEDLIFTGRTLNIILEEIRNYNPKNIYLTVLDGKKEILEELNFKKFNKSNYIYKLNS